VVLATIRPCNSSLLQLVLALLAFRHTRAAPRSFLTRHHDVRQRRDLLRSTPRAARRRRLGRYVVGEDVSVEEEAPRGSALCKAGVGRLTGGSKLLRR